MLIQVEAKLFMEILVGIRGFRVLSKEERMILDQVFISDKRALGYVLDNSLMSVGHGSLWCQSDWDTSYEVRQRQWENSEKTRLDSIHSKVMEEEVISKLKTCPVFQFLDNASLASLARDIVLNKKPSLVIGDTELNFESIYDKQRE